MDNDHVFQQKDVELYPVEGLLHYVPDPNAYHQVAIEEDEYNFDVTEDDVVQRRLKQRHVQMITIAGTLGTGVLLGSGAALAGAGPLGALIAYAFVGTIAYCTLASLGEMTTHAPISGSFPHFAARWVDPALGFAVGWNYFLCRMISMATQVSAAPILITLWDSDSKHAPAYVTVAILLVLVANLVGVRWFGETEFTFTVLKLLLLSFLIVFGLVIDLGGVPPHSPIVLRYWKSPGPLSKSGLVPSIPVLDYILSIINEVIQASFSFHGLEMMSIAASEVESPRRNIPIAVKKIFNRIITFYMLSIFVIGLLVSHTNPELISATNKSSQSPFIIALQTVGQKVGINLVEAGILLSALTAASSYLFCASRVLYGLALRAQAPRFLTHCTEGGLPIYAVLVTASGGLPVIIYVAARSASDPAAADAAYSWLKNLTATSGLLGWCSINITYLFYYRGMRAQKLDLARSFQRSPRQPRLALWGAFWTGVFVFGSGFAIFFHVHKDVSEFVSFFFSYYLSIPIFIVSYLGYKVVKQTKVWRPLEMDFVTGIPTLAETETPIQQLSFWEKLADVIF